MAKVKSKWVCQSCGYETSGYLGKCPDCANWGTILEEITKKASLRPGISPQDETCPLPKNLKDISIDESLRYSTGMTEFDTVLGGGLVRGSLVLLGGDPGIGKSTLTLQACGIFAENSLTTLYISAEESAKQIKLRAERLNVDSENLFVLAENNIELIQKSINALNPSIIVIDSIQAVYTENISGSAGSVSQVRECCSIFMSIAKSKGITVLIIGHVTKDGMIAGPKVLEHMVDSVLYFEGDRYKSYRVLRAIKNRYGSTNETGIFSMDENGLSEVENPSALFLSERSNAIAPGSVVISACEGARSILVEIQALVGHTPYPSPRRVATGIEYNRVLQILAVLEKRVGLNLSKQDVYVNAVGGMEIAEPSADLGIALAIATCARNVTVNPETVIIGELGLSGEVRRVGNIEAKLNEASKLGFKKAIVPKSNLPLKNTTKNLEVLGVARLMDAISASMQ